MSYCQNFFLSNEIRNVVSDPSEMINPNEEVGMNDENQIEMGSNNVTLTNASMTETNSLSFQECSQNVCAFNTDKFKNVTIRANDSHEVSIANDESFEKKRGFSLTLEIQRQLKNGLNQSFIDDNESRDESVQNESRTKLSGIYLEDNYQDLHFNEEFRIGNLIKPNSYNDVDPQIPPKINQFHVDELENEKATNSLKNNDSANSDTNSNSRSSSYSVSSSSASYRSDSSYTNEDSSYRTIHCAHKQLKERKIPILNQNAPCFKPKLTQNLNLTKTSTPTNKMNGKDDVFLSKGFARWENSETDYCRMKSENSKFLPRSSSSYSKFLNDTHNQNYHFHIPKTDAGRAGDRVPRSLTTNFSEYRQDDICNLNNFPITFGHSTSFDNIGEYAGEFSGSKRFKNVTYRCSDNNNNYDFIDANNFSCSTRQPNNLINHNEARKSGEPIVLHVRNLDYKIGLDEWQRILLESFRKHCKEVF